MRKESPRMMYWWVTRNSYEGHPLLINKQTRRHMKSQEQNFNAEVKIDAIRTDNSVAASKRSHKVSGPGGMTKHIECNIINKTAPLLPKQ